MAFMTKKSKIQAWLNGLYTENRYGQRMTSGHVHAGRRPGIPAPVMIKRNPILQRRNEQYSAVGISLVNQNQTCKHMIRVPAGLFALWCSCCRFSVKDQRPLDWWFFCHSNCGYFVKQFAKPFTLKCVIFGTRPVCIPKSYFAKISFCQSIVMPKVSRTFPGAGACIDW